MAIARLGEKRDPNGKIIDYPLYMKELDVPFKSKGKKDTNDRIDTHESVVICRVV